MRRLLHHRNFEQELETLLLIVLHSNDRDSFEIEEPMELGRILAAKFADPLCRRVLGDHENIREEEEVGSGLRGKGSVVKLEEIQVRDVLPCGGNKGGLGWVKERAKSHCFEEEKKGRELGLQGSPAPPSESRRAW